MSNLTVWLITAWKEINVIPKARGLKDVTRKLGENGGGGIIKNGYRKVCIHLKADGKDD